MKKLIFIAVLLFIGVSGSYSAQVSIIIQERDGIARAGEPVTLGVPFAEGELKTGDPVRIVNPSGNTVDAQFKTMALWGDGSIKWLKCDFQADAAANSTVTYTLKTDTSTTPSTELTVSQNNSSITVTTGPLRFTVSKTAFNLLDQAWLDLDGNRQYAAGEKIISAGQSAGPVVTKSGTDYRASAKVPEVIEVEEQGPMKVVIKVSGRHYNGSSQLLKYETRIYAYAGKSYVRLWHVYANGKTVASLGFPLDPGNGASFDRYGLDLQLNLSGGKTAFFGGDNNSTVTTAVGSGQSASLVQNDRSGSITPLSYDVSRNNTVLSSGSRAGGWGTFIDGQWGVTIISRYFWQKYPKGIVFNDNGAVSLEPAPTPEYFYVAMGSGDEILLYFHSAAEARRANPQAAPLSPGRLFPRASAQQYENSKAFYPLRSGTAPYQNMAGFTGQVTNDHLDNREDLGLYGVINFGDTPVDYWQVDSSEMDASPWGNNYYDCNVLTPIRLFVQEGDLTYTDIFIPGVRHFMETACWNPFDVTDWMSGYCPAYSTYHRATAHFQHHYGEGIWYYYYLSGDERAREVGLRAADAIVDQQWWANQNVDCRMAYQRASACLEAWKNTRDSRYLNNAKHLLVDKVLATQDNYGLIGAPYENTVYGEQTFMMALYSDTLWKYILELSPGSTERQNLITKFTKLADCIDTYARKSPGAEEYWNFFDAPNNVSPPNPDKDETNSDATVYWWGKGLIAGTYAYAYHLTGQTKYKTLATNLLDNLWTAGVIDWGGSEFWGKPTGQVMKNVIHAVAIVSGTTAASLTVTSPNGGESWPVGSSQTITWTSTGSIGSVDIQLSTDGGGNWSDIVSGTANDGGYTWTVPNSVSANCLIRIGETDGSVSDDSNAVFSIAATSSVTLSLSRTVLQFTAILSGGVTGAQPFSIQFSGGTSAWTAVPGASWLSCTPGSAGGSRTVDVTVNPAGLSAGNHSSTITVTAPGAVNSPQTVSVSLTVKQSSQDQAPFGIFSTPLDGAAVAGSIPVTGWVLDDVETAHVKIYYNGNSYIGDAVFVEGARPDVEQAYPDYPYNYRAGWGYMLLTNMLPDQGNGTFTLTAVATDSGGHSVTLGSRTVTGDNANAVKPFGAIDTPAQGGTASGGSFRNYGWALTPQPSFIPTDGSTITVFIDSVPVGSPAYNYSRPDIQTLFPGYANTDGAVGYLDIDTTQYDNGVHTISWSVTDNNGNTGGIGSRYFSIQNTGARNRGPADRGDIVLKDLPERGALKKRIRELERLVIRLEGKKLIAGYLLVGDRLRALPIGSTLDRERRIFYWRPGPGFVGNYSFVFFIESENGERSVTNLHIKILPLSKKR